MELQAEKKNTENPREVEVTYLNPWRFPLAKDTHHKEGHQ